MQSTSTHVQAETGLLLDASVHGEHRVQRLCADEEAGGAPPEAGTRNGRSRSRRTCAACRCRRALGRPQAGPRCVSSSCPQTAATRGLQTYRHLIMETIPQHTGEHCWRMARGVGGPGPLPFFVTIELASTTMTPAQRRTASPARSRKPQSAGPTAFRASTVHRCAAAALLLQALRPIDLPSLVRPSAGG